MKSKQTVLLLTLLLAASCNRPTSVAFEKKQTMLLTPSAVPIPPATVLDSSGKPLLEAKVEFSAEPKNLVMLTESQLTPMENGRVTLTARVKGTDLTTTMIIEIQILDRIDIDCIPEHCSFQVGEEVEMVASMRSQGVSVKGVEGTWTSDNEKVAKVLGPGKIQPVRAGSAVITVSAGATKNTKKIRISAPPDRLYLKCPPTRVASSVDEEEKEPRCMVPHASTTTIIVEAFGQGEPVDRPEITWSSSEPTVASIQDPKGVIFGHQVGRVTIKATINELEATIDMRIAKGQRECKGDYKATRVGMKKGKKKKKVNVECRVEDPDGCLGSVMEGRYATPDDLIACCCKILKSAK